jgi:glucose/mannose-6-phosphate isomerase
VLAAMGSIPPVDDEVGSAAGLLGRMAAALGPQAPIAANEAKRLAEWLGDRTPVVWGSEGPAEAAALRWKTQFNENAKVPAWASVLPELDHNEIEGWSEGRGNGFGALVLRHPGEHPRIPARVEATMEAAAPSGLEVRQVHAEGQRPLEWLLSLVMLGDFASIYLAVLRSVDPMPIPMLTGLKERLRR